MSTSSGEYGSSQEMASEQHPLQSTTNVIKGHDKYLLTEHLLLYISFGQVSARASLMLGTNT